ncbi:MAG: NUDIX domain-containing protein [Actinobacteria bacterium]|nr:NUDIX domain-containing protein [Actinomycetota bacterium]
MAPGVVERVRAEVAALTPADPRGRRSRRRVLDGLARLDRPFDERAGPVHATASAIVVGPRGTLLHRHKRLGVWMQPGGHVDHGETPWEAAERETAEETGVPGSHPAAGPRLVHTDVHRGGRGHTHLDLRYLLLADDVDPSPGAGESPDVRWFAWEEALAVADAGLVHGLHDVRRLLAR